MLPVPQIRRARRRHTTTRPAPTTPALLAALALGLSSSAMADEQRLDELRDAGRAGDVPRAHLRIDALPNVDPSVAARAHALLDRAFRS